jgi:hypothetical protein
MMYARIAEDLPSESKMALVTRSSRAVRDAGKASAYQWADFRGKKTTEVLVTYLTSLAAIIQSMSVIAKALGMDLTGFRAAQQDAQALVASAAKGALSYKSLAPTNLGKVSFAMRDILESSREIVSDAENAEAAEMGPMDLIIFGSDLSIILSAMVVIFRQLKGDPKGLIKARNESLRFFKVLSEETMEAMPEAEGTVEEADIILAATLRKASAMLRRNPKRGFELLGRAEQRIHEVWG